MRTKDGPCEAVWIVIWPSPASAADDERLERRVHDLLRAERMLEDVVRRGEGRLGVAAAQVVVERDVGAALAFEMLEIGERAGRLQHVVHDGAASVVASTSS